jgi:hypothetical protein
MQNTIFDKQRFRQRDWPHFKRWRLGTLAADRIEGCGGRIVRCALAQLRGMELQGTFWRCYTDRTRTPAEVSF